MRYISEPARLVELLQEYYEKFGDKACCFEDLLPFLSLEGDDLTKWQTFLKGISPSFVSPFFPSVLDLLYTPI